MRRTVITSRSSLVHIRLRMDGFFVLVSGPGVAVLLLEEAEVVGFTMLSLSPSPSPFWLLSISTPGVLSMAIFVADEAATSAQSTTLTFALKFGSALPEALKG